MMNTGADFMTQARARSREQKISMTAAMRQLSIEQPKLYEDFRAAEEQRPLRTHGELAYDHGDGGPLRPPNPL